MKHLLIVGMGTEITRRYVTECLRKAGYRLSLLQYAGHMIPSEYDHVIRTDGLSDYPSLLSLCQQLHKQWKIDGILTFVEAATLVVNFLQKDLGLPSIAAGGAGFRYKHEMRRMWRDACLPIPAFHEIFELEAIRRVDVEYPCIVKPIALMGSNGVFKAHTPAELSSAGEQAWGADFSFQDAGTTFSTAELYNCPRGVLVEEYISGPEFSVESIVQFGRVQIIGITQKYLTAEPYFDEVAHVFPARLDTSAANGIRSVTVAAHQALGIQNAFTHTEVRLSERGPVLIELAGRMAGDGLPRLISLALGVEPALLAAMAATAEAIPQLSPVLIRTAGIYFVAAPRAAYGKRLLGLKVPPFARVTLHETTPYFVGHRIETPQTWGASRVGHLIASARESDAVVQWVEQQCPRVSICYGDKGHVVSDYSPSSSMEGQ